jgi:HlyD family secretion protein
MSNKTNKSNNKKRNTILIIAGAILLIALVVAKKKGMIGETPKTKISTEKVERRSIIETITASGKIQPEKEILIAPDASGEIKGLFVKEGDSVKAGQLLLKINPDIYLSALDKVKASLNSSKANLANSRARLSQAESQKIKAESDFNRSKTLHDKSVISDADFEAAKSQYDVAKAEVEAAKENVEAARYAVNNAEAALKEANDNLTKTAVFSPIDGTVSKLSKEVGERVSGASQFSQGTEVLRIANLNNMEAQVDVSENDIVRVHLNDTALIEVDAYLGRKFKGIVSQIANSANTTGAGTDQVTNFTVKIRMLPESYSDLLDKKNPNLSPFRPGMSASVEILTTYEYNVITVPIQAVTTRDDTSSVDSKKQYKKIKKETKETVLSKTPKEYVFVYKDGKVFLREVKVGIQDTDYYQILKGLEEGEEVVSAPYRAISKKLKNKQEVEKVDKDKLFETKEE